MNITNRPLKNIMVAVTMCGLLMAACNKPEHPALGDYPPDTNPPGGPLKFYAAYNGSNVDSIRANFGTDNDVSFTDGVSGNAVQLNGAKNGFLSYPSANDFGTAESFTISFWLNATMAQKDNNHAVGVFAFASSSNFWGNSTWYADNTTKGNSDSMDLKIYFRNGTNDNWDFANYVGSARWPHMYDGKWHHVAFTYDLATKTGTLYRDGVQFDQKTNESIAFENPSQLIVGGFEQAAGVQGDYAGNTWMAGFAGKIDNVRLYEGALSAAEINSLWTNKQ
jgi:Concanavalin A-like lectin/glucanases superfamily